MKYPILIFACIFVFIQSKSQTIGSMDLEKITGNWQGQLTYLDYSSNKEVSIKASLVVSKKKENYFILKFDYPDEPGRGSLEKYRIKNKGRRIGNYRVSERLLQNDGSLKIILEELGKDGNDQKPATFQHVLEIGGNSFSISKLVKFDDARNYIQRNCYSFKR